MLPLDRLSVRRQHLLLWLHWKACIRMCTRVPIQVSVYSDHIVFWNSGELPNGWDIKRLVSKHPSLPFNPLIANVVNSEHTHPEKRPPFRNITTQNASIFIEKGVRIREIAQVFRSNATQPLSIAF